jgi:hypothetical protein
MAYDSGRTVTLLVGNNGAMPVAWQWNGVTWSPAPSPPIAGYLAYDPVRARTVSLSPCATHEFDGISWSGSLAAFGTATATSLLWDPSQGKVVVANWFHPSHTACATYNPGLWHWDGTVWTHFGQEAVDVAYVVESGRLFGRTPPCTTFLCWSSYAEFVPPSGGSGQPNSGDALLDLATMHWQAGSGAGPHAVNVPVGSTLTLAFTGPAYMPFLLFLGPMAASPTSIGCFGLADIGSPSLGFQDVFLFLNGLASPVWSIPFGFPGVLNFQMPIPNGLAGITVGIQGLVFQPGAACPGILTAAYHLTFL